MRCRICKNLRKGEQLDNVRFAVYGCAASTYRHIECAARISTRIVSLWRSFSQITYPMCLTILPTRGRGRKIVSTKQGHLLTNSQKSDNLGIRQPVEITSVGGDAAP